MNSSEPGNPTEEFAALWESMSDSYAYVNPRRGDIRDGTILSVRPDEIILDIGSKEDAFVASREVERMSREEIEALQVGATVKVFVLRFDRTSQALLVSLAMAAEQQDWFDAQEAMESGKILTVTVTQFNKGGLLASYKDLQGFLPASQVVRLSRRALDESPSDAFGAFVGRQLAVKVIEVNRQRRRLILSERAAARETRDQKREELLESLEPGEIRAGTVSNLVEFGAFVDLGGVDGLVHISELSWGRVNRASEVLHVGQEVDVMVLNIDRDRQRIALSIKRTLPDPWSDVEERHQAGQIVKGVVTHLVKFGAFVELEPGVEGLVHISELSARPLSDPAQAVKPGDELTLMVLGVDVDRHRISLSLRQVSELDQTEPEGVDAERVDPEPAPGAETQDMNAVGQARSQTIPPGKPRLTADSPSMDAQPADTVAESTSETSGTTVDSDQPAPEDEAA